MADAPTTVRGTLLGSTVQVSEETARLLGSDFRPEGDGGSGAPKGNAGAERWAAYAVSLGIEVPEGAKRDDIKALVEAHDASPKTE